jgi:hypothetical protein
VFATGVSVPLFLATQLIVFNEAELWGVALALGAFDLMLAYLANPRGRMLALASACTTAAMLSRPTVGAGAVAALGLLLIASFTVRTRRFAALSEDAGRLAGWLALAVAVPIGAYVYVNLAKFQTPFGLPFDRQFVTFVNAEHRLVLAANDGSLFGLQFLPTNLLQYFRPDGIRLTRLWPWIRFPGDPTIIGDVRYDRITPTSSVVAAMALAAVLSLVGFAAMLSARRARESAIAALRVPVIGAAIGTVPVLIFGFVAQRYLGDFVPLLVLLGVVGLHVVLGWALRWHGWRRALTWAGLALLTVFTIWSGIGLAVLYQRIVATDDSDLRAFVRSEFALQRRFPGGAPALTRVRRLPERAPLGTVAVVDDCRGVYVSTGTGWRALERMPAMGGYRLRIAWPPAGASRRTAAPLLRAGSDRTPMMFFVETRADDRAIFRYSRPDGGSERSRPVTLKPGPHVVDLVLDPRTQEVGVAVDGTRVLAVVADPAVRRIVSPPGEVAIGDGGGRSPAPGRFPGAISTVRVAPAFCRDLTDG